MAYTLSEQEQNILEDLECVISNTKRGKLDFEDLLVLVDVTNTVRLITLSKESK